VIVSAGAIASSLLLQRSGAGNPLVGKHLSFNMATPLTAYFEERMVPAPYDGLQISHYFKPPRDDGYVLESWFNPPAMQSLFMPGWFEDHARNMRDYAQMGSAGAVVGTERSGRISPGIIRGDFRFEPSRDDMAKLVNGMKQLGAIYLAAGAKRVMPSTFRYQEFKSDEELDAGLTPFLSDRRGLSINSAHPQGGNAISADPSKGVVDERFCVHGFENLHVCDASVFPTSITVNPQLTVMALAHYAAGRIGGKRPPDPEDLRFAQRATWVHHRALPEHQLPVTGVPA
jgi:choline dehydrogenase-like flavoprotein